MEGSEVVVRWLPGAERLAASHRAAGQQLDNLCAAHWASILLRADGIDADPVSLAREAGTILPPGDPHRFIPEGADPNQDYGATLPVAGDAAEGGTSIHGVIEAVASASGGAKALIPLRVSWSADRVAAVIDLCVAHPSWEAVPLANLRTGSLWGTRLPLSDAMAWLGGGQVEPPAPEWDVGHFVTIAGTADGPSRSMLIIRDSYPAFGWDAHHLQPTEAIAAALERGDGAQGGIALYAGTEVRSDVERAAKDAGFQIEAWDNGTPWPPDIPGGGADR